MERRLGLTVGHEVVGDEGFEEQGQMFGEGEAVGEDRGPVPSS